MIQINQELCIGCGRCMTACPSHILQKNEAGKVENPGKNCLLCMHCGGMCPTGAVFNDGEPAAAEPITHPIGTEDLPILEAALYQRRSYRIFKEKEIPQELLERALKAAMWGDSARNDHPTRWIVVRDGAVRDELMSRILTYLKENNLQPELVATIESGYNAVVGHNSTLIIGYCGPNAINPEQDTAIAITNAQLVLQTAGVGTCWGGFLRRFINNIPGLKDFLHIPEECACFGTILAGYPVQEPYINVPDRTKKAEILFL